MPPLIVWINAIELGSIWVMVASGLVLVFSIMGLLNFAHGQFYMLGAFILYWVYAANGMNYFVGVAAAAVTMAIIGVVVERYLMRPVAKKGVMNAAILTLALIFVFEGLATIIFGKAQKVVPSAFPGILRAGNMNISYEKLVIIGVAVVVMVGLYFIILRTKFGIAIRAAAQDPGAASLFGVNPGRLASIIMAMGCGLAAIAGSLMASVYYVDAWIGGTPLLMSILAIVIGGLGSLSGSVIGGLLLGVIASLVAYYIGPWSELVAFGLVIIILLFRPLGLFGVASA